MFFIFLSIQVSRQLDYGEKDIRKIVDYFENYIRKSGEATLNDAGTTRRRCLTFRYGAGACGLKSRIRQFQSRAAKEEKTIPKEKLFLPLSIKTRVATILDKKKTGELYDVGPSSTPSSSTPVAAARKNTCLRLKVCQGAVQSKLPLFDKK